MLDPSKRLSVAQIKQHKWMALYVPVQRPVLHQQPLSAEGEAGIGEYSEQVLRLMHSLGIDQHKTIEVCAAAVKVNYWLKLLNMCRERNIWVLTNNLKSLCLHLYALKSTKQTTLYVTVRIYWLGLHSIIDGSYIKTWKKSLFLVEVFKALSKLGHETFLVCLLFL